MKDLNEIYTFLKDKNDIELADLIDRNAEELVKKYGKSADLYMKGQIRLIHNLHEWSATYFRDKLPTLLKADGTKKQKETLMNVEEVANELGISKVTVYTYIKNKTITPVTLGQKGKRNIYRFSREEVEKLKSH